MILAKKWTMEKPSALGSQPRGALPLPSPFLQKPREQRNPHVLPWPAPSPDPPVRRGASWGAPGGWESLRAGSHPRLRHRGCAQHRYPTPKVLGAGGRCLPPWLPKAPRELCYAREPPAPPAAPARGLPHLLAGRRRVSSRGGRRGGCRHGRSDRSTGMPQAKAGGGQERGCGGGGLAGRFPLSSPARPFIFRPPQIVLFCPVESTSDGL